jgi:hypothetical protein
MWGCTTARTALVAMAASMALPPSWRIRIPASVAKGWGEATTPRRPRMLGRWKDIGSPFACLE